MKLLRVSFIAMLLLISNLSFSQTPTDTLNEKQKDILKTLQASGSGQAAETMLTQMFSSFKQMYASVPEEFWEETAKEFNIDQLIYLLVPIYDKHFTHEEIKELLAFYESPIGKKFSSELPLITQESFEVGQKYSTEIAQKVMAKLKDQGY